MKKPALRRASTLITLSAALAASPVAWGAAPPCTAVTGKVQLQQTDPSRCSTVLGVEPLPGPTGPQCFTVDIQGDLRGTGVSGVYAESALSVVGQPPVSTSTPFLLAPSYQRQILTAKSYLELKGGTLISQEIILITPAGDVVEQAQLLIGTGAYANASGSLVILGNSIGTFAKYEGQVCHE